MTGADHSTTLYLCLYVTNKMSLREWLEQITQPLCICVCMWLAKCLYRNDLSWSLNHSVSVSVCLYRNDLSWSLNHSVSVSVCVTYKMYLREWLEQITQPLCICVCMWLTKCLYGNDWSRSLNHSVSVFVCDLQNVFTGMTGADHSTTLYLCLYVTYKMSLREWLEQITQPLCICVCMTKKMSLRELLEKITQPLCICVCMCLYVWLTKCLYGNDWE